MIEFYKYQGTGNDFVMIDNREAIFDNQNIKEIQAICDRRFGVGADGLILIENAKNSDFYVNYFNSDGSKSFCGNGARCSVAFASFLNIIENETTFEAIDGLHEAKIIEGSIHLKMGAVESIEQLDQAVFIDTGSPHYIKFVENISDWNIVDFGKEIRYSEKYKEEGTNVNLVQEKEGKLLLQTYERGVENETFSCGTGATAVALAYFAKEGIDEGKVAIQVKGGMLEVKAEKEGAGFKNIWLIGPGEQVYKGKWKTT